ncbi:hypothetical protein PENTCL1PPCAC_16479, partial [Pristionchus entomophagus]
MASDQIKDLFQFFTTFEIVNNVAAVISNLFLTYLVLFRSSRELGGYRYLLLAFAVNDIYFPIVHFLTLPVCFAYNNAFIMFSYGMFTSTVSISLFASAYSQTMPLLAHLYVYRLIALKWPRHLEFYLTRNTFLLFAVTLGVAAPAWFFNCYINYGSDQETRDYVQPILNEYFNGDGKEFIGALFYSVDGTFRMRAFLATMGFNSIMTISVSIIVFCSVSIVLHFRSGSDDRSEKTKKMQRQLFYTLCLQMIVPMIFVYLPCAGAINLAMFGFCTSVFPNLTTSVSSFFPLADSFVVMYGVKSYR